MADGPIWRRIHAALEEEISTGRYGPGARLPTEAEMAARFAVNRHTVRRALAQLSADGRIHVRRGSGAYVTTAQVEYRIGMHTRFTQNIAAAGKRSGRQVLWIDTVRADAREAEALGIDEGAGVHVAETIGEADGVPVTFGHSVFPAATLPGLPEALKAMRSITLALAECGVADYQRLWTRLTAERPDATVARHLKMPEADAVLRTESLNTMPDGMPVEYALAWFCSARVEFLIDRQSFVP